MILYSLCCGRALGARDRFCSSCGWECHVGTDSAEAADAEEGEEIMNDRYDCQHPNFDDGGVCTACKEFYSAEHDKNPSDIHPAMKRLMTRCEKAVRERNERS